MTCFTIRTLFSFLFFSSYALAYTWRFENNPTQCQNLRVTVDGDDGQPPYRLLMLPYGPAPGQFETRYIQTITFNSSSDGSKHLDFTLNYPSNSQLVAVVGDSNGFATGGTSKPWTVRNSDDNSCFDSTKTRRPKWPYFYMEPNGLRSCEANRIYWNASNPNITGAVNFITVFPGGQSFNITTSPLTDADDQGSKTTGFNWTVPLQPGADIILVSGDEAETGTGGFVKYTVAPPQDASHINCFPTMPSATPAPYSGGDPNADLSKKNTNIGAIAGGAAAGAVVLIGAAIGLWYLLKRRKDKQNSGGGPGYPVNRAEIDNRLSFVPQPYPMSEQQTPFGGPPGSPSGVPLLGPHKSRMPQGHQGGPGVAGGSAGVQYVQHEDADDMHSPMPSQTVDLPPQYNPNRGRALSSASGGEGEGSTSSAYGAAPYGVAVPSSPSRTSFTTTSTNLRPQYYGDKKRPPSNSGEKKSSSSRPGSSGGHTVGGGGGFGGGNGYGRYGDNAGTS